MCHESTSVALPESIRQPVGTVALDDFEHCDLIFFFEGLLWLSQGGARTLLSYGAKQPAELPPEHRNWVASLPLYFDDGRRLFVHAGVNPMLPLDQQSEIDLLWIREPFLSSDQNYNRLIVHGHSPVGSGLPELRSNRLNIDTGAVYGGALTAAVFDDESTLPIAFINDVDGLVQLSP